MKTIRVGVFETNSSSVHTLTITTPEIYEKWKNGEGYVLDLFDEEIVPTPEKMNKPRDAYSKRYYTYKEYYDALRDYDSPIREYEEHYCVKKLPNGDEVVAFGYSGYSG